MTTDNFCYYLQNKLIKTSQTGGQWYTDTSPFSVPCLNDQLALVRLNIGKGLLIFSVLKKYNLPFI